MSRGLGDVYKRQDEYWVSGRTEEEAKKKAAEKFKVAEDKISLRQGTNARACWRVSDEVLLCSCHLINWKYWLIFANRFWDVTPATAPTHSGGLVDQYRLACGSSCMPDTHRHALDEEAQFHLLRRCGPPFLFFCCPIFCADLRGTAPAALVPASPTFGHTQGSFRIAALPLYTVR